MENQQTFRREVANWLEENCPPAMREPARPEDLYNGGSKGEFPCEDARLWFERMLARGWTAPDWPEEYGGAGLNKDESKILKQEMKRLGCRPALAAGQGLAMLGPALLEYGTEQQKREHLPKIARGEVRWCQGYSEPGAGSDLANIQCKAEDKGDGWGGAVDVAPGIKLYQLTETGLALQATIQGTKFWKDDELS